MYSGRVHSFCSNCDTRRATLVTNQEISHAMYSYTEIVKLHLILQEEFMIIELFFFSLYLGQYLEELWAVYGGFSP